MPHITINIPDSLKLRLETEAGRTGETLSKVTTRILALYLASPIHTLFQVSTSGSLVSGVYQAAVTTSVILQHGNFGVGTFENLDGEMVVLDGTVYRVRSNEHVEVAAPNDATPFAVVTKFTPSMDVETGSFDTLAELARLCDARRSSNNIFYAFRLDGKFDTMKTRAVSSARQGGLVEAAGGFLFSSMELETAVRLKSNLVHMIWIDGTYDMVAVQEQAKYGRRSGITFGPIDPVKYGEAFGATGFMIESPENIGSVLKRAFEIDGPVIVGVHVDYRDNHKLFELVHADVFH